MIEIRLDNKRPDNKTLYFGYGDICVSNNGLALQFREFEPPIEVGTWFEDESKVNWLSEKFSIPITHYEEAKELDRLLDSMDGIYNFQFDFKGWRFNFSIWNPKSIKVIKFHLNAVKSNLLMCSAC